MPWPEARAYVCYNHRKSLNRHYRSLTRVDVFGSPSNESSLILLDAPAKIKAATNKHHATILISQSIYFRYAIKKNMPENNPDGTMRYKIVFIFDLWKELRHWGWAHELNILILEEE